VISDRTLSFLVPSYCKKFVPLLLQGQKEKCHPGAIVGECRGIWPFEPSAAAAARTEEFAAFLNICEFHARPKFISKTFGMLSKIKI